MNYRICIFVTMLLVKTCILSAQPAPTIKAIQTITENQGNSLVSLNKRISVREYSLRPGGLDSGYLIKGATTLDSPLEIRNRNENLFDAHGRFILSNYFEWIKQSNTWVPHTRTTFLRSNNGRMNTGLVEYYFNDSNAFIPVNKTDYLYGPDSVTLVSFVKSFFHDSWQKKSRSSYTYGANGLPSEIKQERSTNEGWKEVSAGKCYYNAKNELERYDWGRYERNEWKFVSRTKYTYIANGLESASSVFESDPNSDTLRQIERNTLSYNSKALLEKKIHESIIPIGDSSEKITQFKYTYKNVVVPQKLKDYDNKKIVFHFIRPMIAGSFSLHGIDSGEYSIHIRSYDGGDIMNFQHTMDNKTALFIPLESLVYGTYIIDVVGANKKRYSREFYVMP